MGLDAGHRANIGLPKDKLTVTVFSEDDEAHALWKKIAGLPDSRIIRIPTSDNFWSMGDTGPCGPCSEIFYDHGDKIWGGPPGSAEADGDRFIEIWNLVFMQYEQVSKEERVSLPKPSIDTGMGLERIAAVLQGTHDNYETDLFRALIAAIVEQDRRSGRRQGQGLEPGDRRSLARLLLPHRRWRAAVERGPRLCAPPHHAPRHAPCRAARRARAADVQAGAHRWCARWARPIRSWCAREAMITETLLSRGEPLPQDAGARLAHSRRRVRRACPRATPSRARPPSSSTTPMAFRST